MRVLIAEHNTLFFQSLQYKLNKMRFDIVHAENGLVAKDLIERDNFDFIIASDTLPFFSGIELISYAKANKTAIYLMGDVAIEERMIEAYQLGVQDYIIKPFSPFVLVAKIESSLQVYNMQKNSLISI